MKLDPDDSGANRWLVFFEQEEMLGILDLPLGATREWTDGHDVWLAVHDAFDVPWLVRYRIVELSPRS
jgi:hypothetical protein